MIYVVEAYYVDNRLQKDNSNWHIILAAKNRQGFKEINKIISESNKTGFYYKNRIDLELLLSLSPENVIITTACVMSRLFKTEDYEEKFLIPILNHFKTNLYLEVQPHPHLSQAKYNHAILNLSNKYKISIIHANDSHYIYENDYKDRNLFLKGKGIKYENEEGFILDYPDYETILKRYKEQRVLTEEQAKIALKNTLIFDECEDLGFTKEIKMPSIYPNENKNKKLQEVLNKKWLKEKENISKEKYKNYIEAIRFEYDIISKTNMADYFLLNERIVDKAVNEYGGVLSRTGRGSCVSFYINKLLGFTEVDRLDTDIPLYPTRFMSISRILETGSLPDIDYNWADPEPAIKASKDILGEDNIYIMIAYGTMQESAAFRNICRAYNLKIEEYNEVAKNLDNYKDDSKWKDLIEQSKKFIGVIDSVSPSPCSFLLLDKPISEEIGVIRIGDILCACIDGYTSDVWKYLKNDFLTVTIWKIVSETYKLLNQPIPNIRELKSKLNDKVWELYEKGLTATLNQVDTDYATHKVKIYKPKTPAELCAFVAAIRPGFHSLVDNFLQRKEYSTNIKELDEILSDSFYYMLYQESIMKFLMWCGIKEEITYDIIKKIAKKKFKEEELKEFKDKLLKEFINKTGSSNNFENVWQVVEDAVSYSFNSSHAYCMGLDSLYCAYLKANYPLEYYTVILNIYSNDTDKTEKIINELSYFGITIQPIKFRKSQAQYSMDKETNSIYKGIASIKHLNSQIAEDLYQLKDNNYPTFVDLLVDIKNKTSVNSKQMTILIKLNFFSEFGKNKKLLRIYEQFQERYKPETDENIIIDENLSDKEKKKLERKLNTIRKNNEYSKLILDDLKQWEKQLSNESQDIILQLQDEKLYLGYCQTKIENINNNINIVFEIDTKYTPKINVYNLKNGQENKYKISKKLFKENKLESGDVITVLKTENKPKWRKTENGFEETSEKEEWIISYYIANKEKLNKYINQITTL